MLRSIMSAFPLFLKIQRQCVIKIFGDCIIVVAPALFYGIAHVSASESRMRKHFGKLIIHQIPYRGIRPDTAA